MSNLNVQQKFIQFVQSNRGQGGQEQSVEQDNLELEYAEIYDELDPDVQEWIEEKKNTCLYYKDFQLYNLLKKYDFNFNICSTQIWLDQERTIKANESNEKWNIVKEIKKIEVQQVPLTRQSKSVGRLRIEPNKYTSEKPKIQNTNQNFNVIQEQEVEEDQRPQRKIYVRKENVQHENRNENNRYSAKPQQQREQRPKQNRNQREAVIYVPKNQREQQTENFEKQRRNSSDNLTNSANQIQKQEVEPLVEQNVEKPQKQVEKTQKQQFKDLYVPKNQVQNVEKELYVRKDKLPELKQKPEPKQKLQNPKKGLVYVRKDEVNIENPPKKVEKEYDSGKSNSSRSQSPLQGDEAITRITEQEKNVEKFFQQIGSIESQTIKQAVQLMASEPQQKEQKQEDKQEQTNQKQEEDQQESSKLTKQPSQKATEKLKNYLIGTNQFQINDDDEKRLAFEKFKQIGIIGQKTVNSRQEPIQQKEPQKQLQENQQEKQPDTPLLQQNLPQLQQQQPQLAQQQQLYAQQYQQQLLQQQLQQQQYIQAQNYQQFLNNQNTVLQQNQLPSQDQKTTEPKPIQTPQAPVQQPQIVYVVVPQYGMMGGQQLGMPVQNMMNFGQADIQNPTQQTPQIQQIDPNLQQFQPMMYQMTPQMMQQFQAQQFYQSQLQAQSYQQMMFQQQAQQPLQPQPQQNPIQKPIQQQIPIQQFLPFQQQMPFYQQQQFMYQMPQMTMPMPGMDQQVMFQMPNVQPQQMSMPMPGMEQNLQNKTYR